MLKLIYEEIDVNLRIQQIQEYSRRALRRVGSVDPKTEGIPFEQPSLEVVMPQSLPRSPQHIGYLRVSTLMQSADRQLVGMKERCDVLYLERVGAASAHRLAFDEAMRRLRPGDTFVVWDLDRAFRSTVDAINTAERLRERGIHFQIVGLHLDTASPEGELFYTILAAFGQFERRIIQRRTREGMEAARLNGKHLGRPRALSADLALDAYRWMLETHYPCRYVAALLGVSRITLQRAFHRIDMGE